MAFALLALFALLGRSAAQCPGNPDINPQCCDCCPVGICAGHEDALKPQCAACSECHGPDAFDPSQTYTCPSYFYNTPTIDVVGLPSPPNRGEALRVLGAFDGAGANTTCPPSHPNVVACRCIGFCDGSFIGDYDSSSVPAIQRTSNAGTIIGNTCAAVASGAGAATAVATCSRTEYPTLVTVGSEANSAIINNLPLSTDTACHSEESGQSRYCSGTSTATCPSGTSVLSCSCMSHWQPVCDEATLQQTSSSCSYTGARLRTFARCGTSPQPTTTTGIFRAGDDLTLTSEGSIIANGLDLGANAAATTAQIGDLLRELGALRAEIQSCQCSTEAPTTGIEWIYGGQDQSCIDVCATESMVCSESTQATLTTANSEAVRTAFSDAGVSCNPDPFPKTTCETGNGAGNQCAQWGAPYGHGENLFCNVGNVAASCGQRPARFHRRLCACERPVMSTVMPTFMPTTMPTFMPTVTPTVMPSEGLCVRQTLRGNISNFGSGGRTNYPSLPATFGRPCTQCGRGYHSFNDAMRVYEYGSLTEDSPPLPSSSAADLLVGRGFESTCELMGQLDIVSASAITSTELETAFSQLEWLSSLQINNVSGLTSFGTAFTQLQGDASNLVIRGNANLATLGTAFSQLEYVGQHFHIDNNPALSSLGSAFSSLKRIKGQLHVYGNDLDEADLAEVFRSLECHGTAGAMHAHCPNCPAWIFALPPCA